MRTNVGLLVQKRARLVACTPSGVMQLLAREGIALAGQRAVVIGRSDIVGKPMALLLLHRDATVTICHSRTPDVARAARARPTSWWPPSAVPRYVTPAFVKPGATVDRRRHQPHRRRRRWSPQLVPGRPRRAGGSSTQKGSLLVGDVHPDVWTVAGAVTPVPGGVGPLTIAMLLANTVTAAEARAGLASAGVRRRARRADGRHRDGQERRRRAALREAGVATVDADAAGARGGGAGVAGPARPSSRASAPASSTRRRRARPGRPGGARVRGRAPRARTSSAWCIRAFAPASTRSSPACRPARRASPRSRSSTRPGWAPTFDAGGRGGVPPGHAARAADGARRAARRQTPIAGWPRSGRSTTRCGWPMPS